jgi:hypothetical protein
LFILCQSNINETVKLFSVILFFVQNQSLGPWIHLNIFAATNSVPQ